MSNAAAVYNEFARHAFELGRSVQRNGTPVYLMYDPTANEEAVREWTNHEFRFHCQNGINLGDRMRNAFEVTFRDGFTRTVIIGTDVPELEVPAITESFDLLGTHRVVLGPSKDGGYYLLGLHVPMIDLFQDISWSSCRVLDETLLRIRSFGGTYHLLPELADIDTEDDYRELLRRRMDR